MPLAMEVGLGPGNIVLNGDPAAPTERGAAQWRNRGGAEGGSCPRAQQLRGRKIAWPKYFMTNDHKIEFDIVF